jgi:hypothetical protein
MNSTRSYAMHREFDARAFELKTQLQAPSHFGPLLDAQKRHHARSRYTKRQVIDYAANGRVHVKVFAAGDQRQLGRPHPPQVAGSLSELTSSRVSGLAQLM